MNKPPNPRRLALREALRREADIRRGETRGQSAHWKARSNRKLPRIAVRN